MFSRICKDRLLFWRAEIKIAYICYAVYRVYHISLDNQKKEVFGNLSYMKISTDIVK